MSDGEGFAQREIEIGIAVPADTVWSAIRDVYEVHHRLVPGMVVATAREDDVRVVTFANGAVARERIIAIDDVERRLTYGVVGGGLEFHEASMQVVSTDTGSRLTWSARFLPVEVDSHLQAVMEQGIAVMKATLERS